MHFIATLNRIPLSDATGLIWIEEKLDRKDLAPTTRTELETLRRRGIELVDMPTEAMAHLDSAINIIKNQLSERSGA